MWLMATSLDREKNISIITVSTLGQSVLESLIHQIAKEKQKKKTEKEKRTKIKNTCHLPGRVYSENTMIFVFRITCIYNLALPLFI